jgi:hypothetical protein
VADLILALAHAFEALFRWRHLKWLKWLNRWPTIPYVAPWVVVLTYVLNAVGWFQGAVH